MFITFASGRGFGKRARREKVAQRFDAIADQAASTLRHYDVMLDRNDYQVSPRVWSRINELVMAEKNARITAARIRSGLE